MHHFNEKNIKEGESVGIVQDPAIKYHGLFSALDISPFSCLYLRDCFENCPKENIFTRSPFTQGEKHPSARESVG